MSAPSPLSAAAVGVCARRLAPEHRYPAPSDDLRAAYLRVSQRGVAEDTCAGAAAAESNSARSRRIALIAESSGCSLALSLVRRSENLGPGMAAPLLLSFVCCTRFSVLVHVSVAALVPCH
eukprot:4784170-Pleurochrysis_carterae.AAC.2